MEHQTLHNIMLGALRRAHYQTRNRLGELEITGMPMELCSCREDLQTIKDAIALANKHCDENNSVKDCEYATS